MKVYRLAMCIILVLGLSDLSFGKGAGKGYMGGSGVLVDAPSDGGGMHDGGTGEEPTDPGGMPGDIDGPLGDNGSIEGELYGDLYKVLRYKGGETKLVPKVDVNGDPVYIEVEWTDPNGNTAMVLHQDWVEAVAVGGEPILTENFVDYTVIAEDTGEFVINPATNDIWFSAPTASQCVQPLANFERWGDLSSEDNAADFPDYADIEFNAIPLVMTYDPTWDRTEAAVGTVDRPVYFIPPGGIWTDPKNGPVTYVDGVLWTDLIQEVSFGRLNQARAPDAVHQAAFDEAIVSLNLAVAIGVDASGRLLLTKAVYDEYLVDPATGDPLLIGYVEKAIDSPLENLAIYLKLMRDGHLVTPGDERAPIDRSLRGGIPLEQLLGLEDGPSKALRPTIDIQKLRDAGLGALVDVQEEVYYTYFDADNVLHSVTTQPPGVEGVDYEVWVGIHTRDGSYAQGADFEFCAATLSAAADKTGKITVDHVVYLNNILGINRVVGTNEDGTIDYTRNPVYFDYGGMNTYNRSLVFNTRGYYEYDESDPNGDPIFVPGSVVVLQTPESQGGDPAPGVWEEYSLPIIGSVSFRELGETEDRFPSYQTAVENIGGFAQAADDDLSVIGFVHTYQIPENR